MQNTLRIGLVFLSILAAGCNQDDETPIPAILQDLEGTWQFQQGILDAKKVERWSDASMAISIESDSSLRIEVSNQPFKRLKIWPSESTIVIVDSKQYALFYRDDGIDINFSLNDNMLKVTMQPPREWSYEEECDPPVVHGFQCSGEGSWYFELM